MQQATQIPSENPPPYESAPNRQQVDYDSKAQTTATTLNNKPPVSSEPSPNVPVLITAPSYVPQLQGPGARSPTVYHYVNPRTREHVTSLLPPDHPEMICLLEGGHVTETRFGLVGLLAAIFWFPLGVGLCLLDRRVRCRRCGSILEDGICGP